MHLSEGAWIESTLLNTMKVQKHFNLVFYDKIWLQGAVLKGFEMSSTNNEYSFSPIFCCNWWHQIKIIYKIGVGD